MQALRIVFQSVLLIANIRQALIAFVLPLVVTGLITFTFQMATRAGLLQWSHSGMPSAITTGLGFAAADGVSHSCRIIVMASHAVDG